MSVNAIPASSSRSPRLGRSAGTATRSDDAINPARGVMIGLGLSAMIWTGIGALLLR